MSVRLYMDVHVPLAITEGLRLRGVDVLTAQEVLRAQEWLSRTERFLADVWVVPFDAQAVQQFDRLRSVPGLRKMGRADLLIASMALARRATLVTRNVRHFPPVPGLTVENWMD